MTDANIDLADLADGTLSGPEWDAWLAAHPEAAEEVAIARRVRALLLELHAAEFVIPEGFEERLLARVHEDTTLLNLLDLGFGGMGQALLEILSMLLGLLPQQQPAPAT